MWRDLGKLIVAKGFKNLPNLVTLVGTAKNVLYLAKAIG